MNERIVILLASLLLWIPSPVFADNSQNPKMEGPYVRLGIGGGVGRDDNYAAIKLSGGIDLNRHLGVEAGATAITNLFVADVDFLYLSLIAKRAIGKRTTIAGKLGVVRWDSLIQPLFSSSLEDDGVNAMFGAELEYGLLSQLSIVLALEHYGSVDAGSSSGDEAIIIGTLNLGLRF